MGRKFRWLDAIRAMSVDDLSHYLVKECFNFHDGTWWSSPSGNKFDYYDDALEDCIQWLNSKYDGRE